MTTRQKETLDNDRETFESDAHAASASDWITSSATQTAIVGETRLTKKIETVDEDPEDHHDID